MILDSRDAAFYAQSDQGEQPAEMPTRRRSARRPRPGSRVQKRTLPRKQSHAGAIAGTTILASLAVLLLILLRQGEEVGATPSQAPVRLPTGMDNIRVSAVVTWAESIASGDLNKLERHSDLATLNNYLNPGTDYLSTGSGEILKLIIEHDETSWFRQFEITSAEIQDRNQAMASSDRGTVMLYMVPKPEYEDRFTDRMEIAVSFQVLSEVPKVTRWSILRMPAKIRQKKIHSPLAELGAAKTIDVEFGGEASKAVIAAPKPLGHLEETDPELRIRIDGLILSLIEVEAPARSFRDAKTEILEIGKPAVPRLLNALYEIDMSSQENLIRLRRITATLEAMTGRRFGFNPSAVHNDAFSGATNESRQLALEQWFGWWTNNYDKPIDSALKAAREAEEGVVDVGKQRRGGRSRKR